MKGRLRESKRKIWEKIHTGGDALVQSLKLLHLGGSQLGSVNPLMALELVSPVGMLRILHLVNSLKLGILVVWVVEPELLCPRLRGAMPHVSKSHILELIAKLGHAHVRGMGYPLPVLTEKLADILRIIRFQSGKRDFNIRKEAGGRR